MFWFALLVVVALAAGAFMGWIFARIRGSNEPERDEASGPDQHTQNEADFASLVAALPLGVVVVDRHARIRFANSAAGTIFDFDPERAIGSHVITSIPNVELERRIDDALIGEASVAPITVASATQRRTYGVSVSPIGDNDSGGVVVFADDQTDIERLLRASKEFLTNVSHELRTPLSSIKLMLETVVESPDDEAADLFLPQVLVQVDRLASLVQQLLDQARAESGQLHLNLREIDLEEVAHPIVASFEPQAANKGVQVELRAIRPVSVEADPDRLSQVFVNLIDNAIRHTPSGGFVTVELDANGNDAIMRVRDTGMGIPYRDIPHIFERFYVVDRSRTRESSGAGLGLAIVKGIIDAHGGTVATESMLGSGTLFTVRLPIMRVGPRV